MPTTHLSPAPPQPANRIVSLDQFRGYTVIGMLLVNFLGGFVACPKILRHSHDYVSYADTIMPQFLFAVGFAFRLTFGRHAELQGTPVAYGRVVRRMLGLVLVALVVYAVPQRAENWQKLTEMTIWDIFGEPLKRNWFQTLMHIAVTALWLVPVIRARAMVRIGWMLGSAIAHVGLSYWFNFTWVNTAPNGIDGGPLAFLTWTIPAIVGTLACDAVASAFSRSPSKIETELESQALKENPLGRDARLVYKAVPRPKLGQMLTWAGFLMVLGYGFSCGTRFYDVPPEQIESLRTEKLAKHPVWPAADAIEAKFKSGAISEYLAEPPFVAPPGAEVRKWNYWMMSQRGGTISYLTFSAGFSLALYVLFFVACDVYGLSLAFFRTFGTNALLAYVLHDLVENAIGRFIPNDSPGWYLTCGLSLFFAMTWLFVRHFERQGAYLRV